MKFSALLPMKGHSERVPNKNMRDFAGRPLYHSICRVLSECENISEIIINTDSEIIKTDAEANFPKAKVIQRPENLCGDMVSMNKIIEYDLQQCENDYIIQTHSTNPLLTLESLKQALDFFRLNIERCDSVFSVTRLQTRLYDENVQPVNHNPTELLRTQDLPPLYEENSNFYIFSKESFLKADNKRIGIKPLMFEINKLEAIDIDEEEDFILAEMIYKSRKG